MGEILNETVPENEDTSAERELEATDEIVKTTQKRKLAGKVKIAIAAVTATVILIAVLLIILFRPGENSPNYDTAVKKSADMYMNPSVSSARALRPEESWQYLNDKIAMTTGQKYSSIDELIEAFFMPDITAKVDALKGTYGEDFKLTYEITNAEEVDSEALNEISDSIKELFENASLTVETAYTLTVSYSIEPESEGQADTKSAEIKVTTVKINGDWYIVKNFGYSWTLSEIEW